MIPAGLGMKAAMGASWASAAGRAVWGNPLGRKMAIGAGAGAGYGLFSRDTSVLGGAGMGAGLGLGYGAGRYMGGARGIYALGRNVMRQGGGMGARAKLAGRGLSLMGRMARRYIGTNYTRTLGAIRGL